jgi:hypothetical protein
MYMYSVYAHSLFFPTPLDNVIPLVIFPSWNRTLARAHRQGRRPCVEVVDEGDVERGM